MENQIYLAWIWNNRKSNSENIMVGNPDVIRRISQALEKGNLVLKSWIEFNRGTVITYGGTEGSGCVPIDILTRIEDVKAQAETEVGMELTFGLGHDLKQAAEALLVAKYTKSGQILLWLPEISEKAAQIKDFSSKNFNSISSALQKSGAPGHFAPHTENTITGWAHKGQAAEPVKESGIIAPIDTENDAESTNPLQAALETSDLKPVPFKKEKINRDLMQILHQHAIKPEKKQDVTQDDTEMVALKNKIGQLLLKIKEKVPNVAALKDEYPDLYDAYIIMAKAFVDLVKQTARKHGFEKNEKELCEEYEPLLKVRFKLGTGLSNLPEGTVFDNRMKIMDPQTGQPKWRSLMAGVVMDQRNGKAASSLNPTPK